MATWRWFPLVLLLALTCALPTTHASPPTDAASHATAPRVCLNMIVRDEERVIERGLRSVAPLVSAVYMTDTGSVDRTMDIARETCKELGLELHLAQDEWTDDFGRNRQQALDRVPDTCAYVLFMDADETWERASDWQWPVLDRSAYFVYARHVVLYPRMLLIANNKSDHGKHQWHGARHEVLWWMGAPEHETRDFVHGLVNVPNQDSTRAHDPLRYHKDAVALRAEHLREPHNARTAFYLARTLETIGDPMGAMVFYEKRVAMAWIDEERMEAQYALAKLWEKHAPERSQQEVDEAFLKAYWLAPFRVEPVLALVQRMRARGDHMQAYLLASMALLRLKTEPRMSEHGVPFEALLFVQQWQYQYGLQTEVVLGAVQVGDWSYAERLALECTQVRTLNPESGDGRAVHGNLAHIQHERWRDHAQEIAAQRQRLRELLL